MDRLTPASDADKASASKIPLGRMGSVKDIADATVYLFSDAASYVNGDVLIGRPLNKNVNRAGAHGLTSFPYS